MWEPKSGARFQRNGSIGSETSGPGIEISNGVARGFRRSTSVSEAGFFLKAWLRKKSFWALTTKGPAAKKTMQYRFNALAGGTPALQKEKRKWRRKNLNGISRTAT
jgi:hypothetical protein